MTLDTFKPFPQRGNVIFINMLLVHTQQDPVLNPGCTSESLRELENILTVWDAALVEGIFKAPQMSLMCGQDWGSPTSSGNTSGNIKAGKKER